MDRVCFQVWDTLCMSRALQINKKLCLVPPQFRQKVWTHLNWILFLLLFCRGNGVTQRWCQSSALRALRVVEKQETGEKLKLSMMFSFQTECGHKGFDYSSEHTWMCTWVDGCQHTHRWSKVGSSKMFRFVRKLHAKTGGFRNLFTSCTFRQTFFFFFF